MSSSQMKQIATIVAVVAVVVLAYNKVSMVNKALGGPGF